MDSAVFAPPQRRGLIARGSIGQMGSKAVRRRTVQHIANGDCLQSPSRGVADRTSE